MIRLESILNAARESTLNACSVLPNAEPLRVLNICVFRRREGFPAKFIKVCQHDYDVGLNYGRSDIKNSATDRPNESLYRRGVKSDKTASTMKGESKLLNV